MDNSLTRNRIEILMLFALYLILLPRVYMDYDMSFTREWALQIHRYGLSNAYDHGINYFPVFVYGLWVYDLFQGTEANIIANINNIKILMVCFDFLPIIVLCGFRQRILQFKIPYLYLLLNIAYVFNSMVWGQIDSIYANLSFLAILTGILYPVTGSVLYLLALNTKPQAIEFIPVMFAVLLYSVRQWSVAIKGLVAIASLQVVILLPWLNNGGVGKLWYFATHAVDLYHHLTICAFNIWYLLVPARHFYIDDRETFIFISYKATGLIMFTASAIVIVWPLLKQMWLARRQQILLTSSHYEKILLGTGLLCLYFFYFNTQMHERYANPIIILFFFYGVISRNYKLYVLASIPYFLSLDKCFPNFLPVHHYKIIWADKILALWYTATVLYGSWLWWQLNKTTALPATEEPQTNPR